MVVSRSFDSVRTPYEVDSVPFLSSLLSVTDIIRHLSSSLAETVVLSFPEKRWTEMLPCYLLPALILHLSLKAVERKCCLITRYFTFSISCARDIYKYISFLKNSSRRRERKRKRGGGGGQSRPAPSLKAFTGEADRGRSAQDEKSGYIQNLGG